MKDIKKMLQAQAKDVLPRSEVKENIRRELGFAEAEREAEYALAHGGTAGEAQRRKRARLSLLAAAMALVIALCILLPVLLHKSPAPGLLDNKFTAITDADSFYAYGAASVGSLLASDAGGGAQASAHGSAGSQSQGASAQTKKAGTQGAADNARTLAADTFLPAQADAGNAQAYERRPSDEQMQTIGRYMALVENLLGRGAIEETAVAGSGGYAYGMQVSYTDLLGDSVSYTLYYDKIFLGGETDGDEREEEYSIVGELIVEGVAYPVEGRYETESEQEEGESEEEVEMEFTAYTGENSFIRASQQKESEQDGNESEEATEYVYAVYEDGRLTERTTVEYEQEEDETELLMTVERGGEREQLLFNDETEDGERVLRVRGDIGGEEVRFTVYIRRGQYHYVFEDGSHYDGGRYDDDGDDDDDHEHADEDGGDVGDGGDDCDDRHGRRTVNV